MNDEHEYLAKWIGSDGKTYATDSPEAVKKLRSNGDTNWVVEPPLEASD